MLCAHEYVCILRSCGAHLSRRQGLCRVARAVNLSSMNAEDGVAQ